MLSFAVTAYRETMRPDGRKRILSCLHAPLKHDAVSEIVVIDDASEDYRELEDLLTCKMPELVFGTPADLSKLKMSHNDTNLGVFGNKLEAIARCTNEWVITCDSDNVMSKEYIDWVASTDKNPTTWYCPSFAKPEFDYRELAGLWNKYNIGHIIDRRMFRCFMNTGNQIVHRGAFMAAFGKHRSERADLTFPNWLNLDDVTRRSDRARLIFDACDSFVYNLTWLDKGGWLWIVGGLEYDHYYTGGQESNYARAPKEKGDLEQVLFGILKEMVT
jgi:glycosyltransferase involved in cell wall biosynthesis